ncbi:MAG: PHP-associated domain-containing protein [Lachnospiraceae bacterium]|nr:PHP-associated domain-containing protein [Lachnospiraceae bacterium]
MKIDLHCHTKEGSLDGKLPLAENVRLLKERGYQGMVLTDHNSYQAYRYYKKHKEEAIYRDFVVLKGIEYDSFDCGHFLIILPTGVKIPIIELRGLPISLLIEIVHHYGGIIGPAHPCGERYLSITNTRLGKKKTELLSKFDFFETFNACESDESNDKAMALAKMFDKPGTGGSDSHREDCAGLGYTEFNAEINNESDLINAIRLGQGITASGESYHKTLKQKLGPVNKVLVYSFFIYNKWGALVRSGKRHTELTQYAIHKNYTNTTSNAS